ncbi:MAG: type III-B CRISPR module RAMP protein Cmr1 [Candidatus Binataceae bacterium]
MVTPLFGGGAEAGTVDETLPIRGTSIRGQLQFWWRATRGADFATHNDLFARHAEIWGTTDRASPVTIEVRNVTTSPARPCASYKGNPNSGSPLAYALFPFQGKETRSPDAATERASAHFIETASFTLRLRFPAALQQEVETAMWAWVNFGGLGARTRRGCGALLCEELAPRDIDDLQRWFRTGSLNPESNLRSWPTMPTNVLVGSSPKAPLEAWKRVIGLLQSFRQTGGIARNPGTQHGRPGRSRYPEPETIRQVTGRRPTQHARLAHIPDDAFPRAEFGLPIVFHFQGRDEPPQTELYPSRAENGEDRERLASPLILKPLALANGEAVSLIMRLVTPPLERVQLKQGNRPLSLPATTVVRGSRLATYRDSPLAGSASGSAVEAFLSYARHNQNGFREVPR